MFSTGFTGQMNAAQHAFALRCMTRGSGMLAAESDDHPSRGRAADRVLSDSPVDRTGRSVRVLVAEDNPADARLIREALHHHGITAELVIHQDGEAMLAYVERIDAGEEPRPDIILLDLNLPRKSGHTVLARLRESASCGHAPVIIVTSSNAARDRDLAAQFGASSYFRKPIDYDEFLLLGALVKQILTHGPPG
jgi:CheY-like chemotaxis protein